MEELVELDENALREKVHELETEKKRIYEEFNCQRAKMKELFLQKEDELSMKKQENVQLDETIIKLKHELNEVKSQLVVTGLKLESDMVEEKRKAEEEIADLQKLVYETMEESSSSKSIHNGEIEQLKTIIKNLEFEMAEMKKHQQHSPHHHHHNQQEQHSLGPGNVLNALTKGLVEKLRADSFSSQDDGSIKKYEDAEVLRSLVEPLEDQIKALKEKLRFTDEQLQKCRECRHDEGGGKDNNIESSRTSCEREANCDMCLNYEAQLVGEQKKFNELLSKFNVAEKTIERQKEELLKEISFRKEMEEKWNEKREELKLKVAELTKSTECAEQDLKESRQIFNQTKFEFKSKLSKLTEDRERIQGEIDKLQNENDVLVGKYTIHSQELQSQVINLPNVIEELHELILKNNQDLIIAKIGKENAEAIVKSLQTNLLLLKDEINKEQKEKETLKHDLLRESSLLKERKCELEKEMRISVANREKISDLKRQIEELLTSKKQLVELNNELKSRVTALQQELDTSETVQKDFVLLSQSLQVELEKIRASDSSVRWQHEEDVETCPICHLSYGNSTSKKKQHCKHCGQIFCQQCLTKVVYSGPNMRASKVCDVCHTLLVQTSAPYFSEVPPPNLL